jgi:hypothetical protein
MQPERGSLLERQIIPIALAALVSGLLILLISQEIRILNHFTAKDITLAVRWQDVLIGLTVYLKTSIDFAIFIGNLMRANGGWRNRISIEVGTAFGNALGTMVVLLMWVIFKEVDWLLALMILVAAFVLLKLAEEGLEHAIHTDREYPLLFKETVHGFEVLLKHVNWFTRPLLQYILPKRSMNAESRGSFWSLLLFSITVPFVLGLDDFAGYVPLFSVVNVFGFTVGVFLAHALLNMFLYLSPERTTKAVKNPIIALVGSAVFVGLAGWGLYEALHLLIR